MIDQYNAVSFQFHKGTIKTIVSTDTTFVNHSFQFHKGTIKTYQSKQRIAQHSYFNSIKVRLKREDFFVPEFADLFQFHKGTIKTRTPSAEPTE